VHDVKIRIYLIKQKGKRNMMKIEDKKKQLQTRSGI